MAEVIVRANEFGQPIGKPLPGWTSREHPPRIAMTGRFCRVEPLNVGTHGSDLFQCIGSEASNDGRWTYLPYGPFENKSEFFVWLESAASTGDPFFHTVTDPQGRAVGLAAYMRIDRANGVIEAGHLNFSPLLQRTPAATEAIYLLLRRAFDELAYRRFEWKCDSLNEPSRRAALRLGFSYEGLFRQAVVYKHRNRDTAWYSITDAEWPARRAALESWLNPANFDAAGRQHRPLSAFMHPG